MDCLGLDLFSALKLCCRAVVTVSSAAILLACGGGGDDSSSGQPSPPSPGPTGATQVTATVDQNNPQAVRTVTQILTATSANKPGAVVELPTSPVDGEPLVMGANSNGDAILLAFSRSSVALSPETTAIALVRMAMGSRTIGTTPMALASAIRNARGFGELKADLTTQIASGGALMDTPNLADRVWTVATATFQSISPSPAATSQVTPSRRAQISPTTLPYYPFNNGATDKIWISDVVGSEKVTISNRTRLAWHVDSTTGANATVDGLSIPFVKAIVGYYGGTENVMDVVGSPPSFQVNARQNTKDVRTRNMLDLVARFTFLMIDVAFSTGAYPDNKKTECALAIAGYAMDSKLSALMDGQSGAAAFDYVRKFFIPSKSDFIDLATRTGPQCAFSGDPVKDAVEGFFRNASALGKILLLSPSIEAVGEGTYQLVNHWNDSYSIQICKRNGAAVPCPSDFYVGSATITDCNVPVGTKGGCNFLSYNINVGNSADLAFKVNGGDLNVRLDQYFGCIGTTAGISPIVGSSFSYTLDSSEPFALDPSSTTTYTVTSATDTTISGTLVIVFDLKWYNNESGSGTAKGTWSVKRAAQSFPKCLRPLYKSGRKPDGTPYGGDTPKFFCSNFGDYWGCHFRRVDEAAREGDWPS